MSVNKSLTLMYHHLDRRTSRKTHHWINKQSEYDYLSYSNMKANTVLTFVCFKSKISTLKTLTDTETICYQTQFIYFSAFMSKNFLALLHSECGRMYMYDFSYLCKTELENGISHLISATA